MHGDSTHPEILEKVDIMVARAIIIALNTDPDAVYTILTARELNPNIRIYVRANEKKSTAKMKRLGRLCYLPFSSRKQRDTECSEKKEFRRQ